MSNSKHPLQIENEERAKTDPCIHCGTPNRTDGGEGFHIYQARCINCDKAMCHSYLFAPWGMTWEGLESVHNSVREQFKRIMDTAEDKLK